MKTTLFILGLLLLSVCVSAVEVSPTQITQTIPKGDVSFHELLLTNTANITETYSISSTDTSVVISGISSVTIPAEGTASFIILLRGEGLAYIKINTQPIVTVDVSLEEKTGFLEPDFVKYKRGFEEGVTSKLRLSLRNHYSEMIEIRDARIENAITTRLGIDKPIGVEGQFGFVNPGGDLTLDILIDTTNLDPGVYLPELYITYYYNDERFETKINFEITVIKALIPTESEEEEEETLKELGILFSPETPKVGDTVSVNLIDFLSKEWMEGTIRVTEIDPNTKEKKISYRYLQPIQVSTYEYCINASKEGYNSKQRCFQSALQDAKIKIVPDPGLNQISVITLVDSLGRIIQDAELTIDGDPNENQATATFTSGSHTITGKATGYNEAKRAFEIKPPFTYNIKNSTDTIDEELIISFSYSINWFVEDELGTVKSGSGSTLHFTPEDPGNYFVIANDEIIHSFTVKEKPASLFSIPSIGIPWWGYIILLIFVVGFIYKKRKPQKDGKVGYGLGGSRDKPAVIQSIPDED